MRQWGHKNTAGIQTMVIARSPLGLPGPTPERTYSCQPVLTPSLAYWAHLKEHHSHCCGQGPAGCQPASPVGQSPSRSLTTLLQEEWEDPAMSRSSACSGTAWRCGPGLPIPGPPFPPYSVEGILKTRVPWNPGIPGLATGTTSTACQVN